MSDRNSGAHFDEGLEHMDRAAALVFARNREVPGAICGVPGIKAC